MIDQQDQDVYDQVGTAFADVGLDRDPEDVIKRGRTLRRRRRAMPALAAAGVLAFSLGAATVAAQSHSSSRTALVNVDEAAFSVHTDASTGVVTITVRDLFDENEFKEILARAGIAAVFHEENAADTSARSKLDLAGLCHWVGAVNDGGEGGVMTIGGATGVAEAKIDPSRMPHGSVLAFSYVTLAGAGHMVSVELLSNTPTGCVN